METMKLVADTPFRAFDADNVHILHPLAARSHPNAAVTGDVRRSGGSDLAELTHSGGSNELDPDRFGAADEVVGLRSALSAFQERLSWPSIVAASACGRSTLRAVCDRIRIAPPRSWGIPPVSR